MLLAVQLACIQALTFVQGHHLAYVILSVALLGFGAGGSLLTLFRKTHPDTLERWYGPLASFAGLSVAWLPRLGSGFIQELEVDLLFTGVQPWLSLAFLGFVLCIPFCAGATALSIIFRTQSGHIGKVYAANLVGSALGASLVLVLISFWLPELVLPVLGLWGLVAGVLFSRRHAWWHALCLAGVVFALLTWSPWQPSQYRDLAYALQLPERDVSGPYAHHHGRVDIVSAPALRYAPDVSLQYRETVPAPPHYFVNGNQAAVMLDPSESHVDILAHTPHGLPYAVQSYASVLMLDPEGNGPVWLAAKDEDTAVDVVVAHPHVAKSMVAHIPDQVSVHRADPRGFLAGQREKTYDLIVFPPRGLFGGPSGLQTLGGDALFTVESLALSLDLLGDSGWLAFPVWLDDPLRHSLRVLSLIRDGLQRRGVDDPADHVLILRGWGSVFFMASAEPIDAEAKRHARDFADAQGFDLIHPAEEDARMRHGSLDEPPALLFQQLLGAEADMFLLDYRFDVSAPTDARPFFNQFIRPGDWGGDLDWLSVSERGMTVVYILLMQLLVAVVLIVLLPLLPLRKQLTSGGGTIGYFSGLGAGFMLYEVALIQLLIPLWGTPVTGAAFVISTLLVGMSLGSLLSGKLPQRFGDVRALTLFACLCLVGIGFGLPHVIRWIMPYGGVLRGLVLGPVLLGSAVLLGIPFPRGVRLLRKHAAEQIPWACGIDGGVGVLAAPSAALFAFYFGYPVVVLLGASAYAVSAMTAHLGWKHALRRV